MTGQGPGRGFRCPRVIQTPRRSVSTQRLQQRSGVVVRVFGILLTLMVLALGPIGPGAASTTNVSLQGSSAALEKVGSVQVRFFGFRLFEAALFTEDGEAFAWNDPFALRLTYDRGFDRDTLLTASIDEMERLEGPRQDHVEIRAKLEACYRTVRQADSFLAVPESRDTLRFYLNGQRTCRIQHSGIRDRLLGIWLSDNARDARMSRQLRGVN